MHKESRLRRKWRRFNRKYGLRVFLVLLIGFVVVAVAALMFALATPNWRAGL